MSRICRTESPAANLKSSGCLEAGLSSGSVACFARSFICSIGGFGLAASMRALSVCSSSAAFAAARRLDGSYVAAFWNSTTAPSRSPFDSSSRPLSRWAREAVSWARSSAIL